MKEQISSKRAGFKKSHQDYRQWVGTPMGIMFCSKTKYCDLDSRKSPDELHLELSVLLTDSRAQDCFSDCDEVADMNRVISEKLVEEEAAGVSLLRQELELQNLM